MKTIKLGFLFVAIIILAVPPVTTSAQDPVTNIESTVKKLFVVIKNDGTEFVGYIISQDEREVLIETKTIGRVFIPKHEIREIREIGQNDMRGGSYLGNTVFSTRYFLTTNGLSMKKGDNYALLNLYGPEAHFALADNFTLGGLTSWIGVPVVVSIKYALHVSENLHFGLGVLGGTLSWYDFGSLGALAYGSMTIGNHTNNFTISGGYAGVTNSEDVYGSAPLFSVAGMVKLGKNVSFVGDSFISAGESPLFIIIPGLRFTRSENRAFQFGFAGVIFEGEAIPFPIPMIGWFAKI